MKTNHFLLLFVAACVLASCQTELQQATGDYSYKTSGEAVSYSATDTLRLTLPNESGTLDIVSMHTEDSVLLTFNTFGGEVYSTHGLINGKDLIFNPFERTLHIGLLTYDITVSGTARRYDETVVFDLTYSGQSQSLDRTLESTKVQTIAKQN